MGVRDRWKGLAELPAGVQRSLEGLGDLFSRNGVELAYVFGSLARGEPAEDVDLALLTRGTPAFKLRQAIEERIGTHRLDLVDLATASPVLRFEVIRTGRPIFVADEARLNAFELQTIHLYRDTQPLRRRQSEYLRERMA